MQPVNNKDELLERLAEIESKMNIAETVMGYYNQDHAGNYQPFTRLDTGIKGIQKSKEDLAAIRAFLDRSASFHNEVAPTDYRVNNPILSDPVRWIEGAIDLIDNLQRERYDNVDARIASPEFDAEKRLESALALLTRLQTVKEPTQFVNVCEDCGEEEANPGLNVCGPCYHKRIWGDQE